ncbi:MAG: FAD-dependent oxidoreductase [Clostridia bacterium]|nr:FAD-dependent oxidoreductase [Clostridia bacterium]
MQDFRQTKINGDYDIIVVGGGIAGVAAAVAAARGGAKTLLIEKTVAFGGLATIGLITWYEPLCDCHGKQMISGIPEELLKLSIKYSFDDLSDEWKNGNKPTIGSVKMYATHYSPSLFIMALDEYLQKNNVHIRLDTMATYPVMHKNHCEGVVCESKSGKEFFGAKLVIDATGDASVMYEAGVPCILGENYFSALAHGFQKEDAELYLQNGEMKSFSRWYSAGSNMRGEGQGDHKLYHGDNADEITEFMVETRKAIFNRFRDTDRNSRDIVRVPMMPTFRTIRHIVGEYQFSGDDENIVFEDSVGSCGDFRQKGKDKRPKHYHIPYRCMYNKNFDNLLACGRIVHCDREGWEITRVIPVAALTGEAAGTAAVLALRSETAVSDIDVQALQIILKKNGVLFEK